MKMILHVSNRVQGSSVFANVRNCIYGIHKAKEVIVLVKGIEVKDSITSILLSLYPELNAFDFKNQVYSNAFRAVDIDPRALGVSMEGVPLSLLKNQGFAYKNHEHNQEVAPCFIVFIIGLYESRIKHRSRSSVYIKERGGIIHPPLR